MKILPKNQVLLLRVLKRHRELLRVILGLQGVQRLARIGVFQHLLPRGDKGHGIQFARRLSTQNVPLLAVLLIVT